MLPASLRSSLPDLVVSTPPGANCRLESYMFEVVDQFVLTVDKTTQDRLIQLLVSVDKPPNFLDD